MGLLLLNTFYGLFTSCIGEIKFMKYYIWPARLIFMFSAIFFTRAVNFSERKRVQKAHIALIQLVRVSKITVRMFYFLGQES